MIPNLGIRKLRHRNWNSQKRVFEETPHHIYPPTIIHARGLCFPRITVDELSVCSKVTCCPLKDPLQWNVLVFPPPSVFPPIPYHSQQFMLFVILYLKDTFSWSHIPLQLLPTYVLPYWAQILSRIIKTHCLNSPFLLLTSVWGEDLIATTVPTSSRQSHRQPPIAASVLTFIWPTSIIWPR